MVAIAGLAGALSFGGSVPLDHLTCCAAALRARWIENAASTTPTDAALNRSRRLQELAAIVPPSSLIAARVASGRAHGLFGHAEERRAGAKVTRQIALKS